MASYNKVYQFVQELAQGYFNLSTSGDTLKIMLTNTLPTSTYKTSTDVSEISAGNGYSAGGSTCQITSSVQTVGTFILLGPSAGVVYTASGCTIGPFRYPVLLDISTTNVNKPLISWYDYGSAITLNSGETFTVSFDPSSGILQLT